jgi:hypothetical protein
VSYIENTYFIKVAKFSESVSSDIRILAIIYMSIVPIQWESQFLLGSAPQQKLFDTGLRVFLHIRSCNIPFINLSFRMEEKPVDKYMKVIYRWMKEGEVEE